MDETKYAASIAKHLGTDHYNVIFSNKDIINLTFEPDKNIHYIPSIQDNMVIKLDTKLKNFSFNLKKSKIEPIRFNKISDKIITTYIEKYQKINRSLKPLKRKINNKFAKTRLSSYDF